MCLFDYKKFCVGGGRKVLFKHLRKQDNIPRKKSDTSSKSKRNFLYWFPYVGFPITGPQKIKIVLVSYNYVKIISSIWYLFTSLFKCKQTSFFLTSSLKGRRTKKPHNIHIHNHNHIDRVFIRDSKKKIIVISLI